MGTSAARKRCDQDKKMNEMASASYLPYNQCSSNARRSQIFTWCWIQTFIETEWRVPTKKRNALLGNLFPWTSAEFHAGKTPVKHTNDRIDDFLKAYFLRKKERVQKFNTSMRMRHTLRIENCLVLCKYKDVVQTLAVLSSALSVIKSPDIFSSIIKYSL